MFRFHRLRRAGSVGSPRRKPARTRSVSVAPTRLEAGVGAAAHERWPLTAAIHDRQRHRGGLPGRDALHREIDCAAPAGTVNVWPLAIGWPSSVTFAFWNVPKRSVRSGFGWRVFSGVDSMWTCNLPPPAAGAAWTRGRGAQSVGVTVIVTVAGSDWVCRRRPDR